METNDNNQTEELFGGLTRDQIRQIELEKRRTFLGTLSAEERHEYFVGDFLSNLNQNAQKQTDVEE